MPMVAMVNAIPAFAIGRKYVFNGRRPKLLLSERYMGAYGRMGCIALPRPGLNTVHSLRP
jgi:hypothetical protein